ncbi:UvrD-helicase domain-containing protein [Fournierella massiliensis]|nr:UvrD-helicase domain-containing protein [Fournierella massiliensis]MCF2556147.1 UvrD-helicase domain-containing protein [Fournierella massiliensis]
MGQVGKAPKWTPAQQRAIEDEGGTLLVSAAAGSGKTAVLVNRALRLICRREDPIPAEQLLIVTFTNAAAAELRSRLAKGLSQAVREASGQGAGRQNFLRRQQMMLGRASIGTIDAFCLGLLQQNFRALEIPPDFTTADEGALYALRRQALDEVLAQAYQTPEFCAFADLYGKSRSDARAGETILRLYDFLRSLPEYRAWLRRSLQSWQEPCPVGSTPWARFLTEQAALLLEEALLYEKGILEACAGAPGMEKLTGSYLPFFEAEQAGLRQLLELARAGDYEGLGGALAGFGFAPLPRVNTRPKKDAQPAEVLLCARMEQVKEQIKDLRQKAKDLTGEVQGFWENQPDFEEDRAAAAPLLEALVRQVEAFDDRYYALKLERKVLEFSDFEHLSLRLLWDGEKGERTELARRVSRNYRVVMVDEYQDTNRLQDLLYHCLANEEGSNLFFVGDMKQGIYSFRQADPEIFWEKRRSFAPMDPAVKDEAQTYPAQLALDRNFRSAAGVIGSINGLCDAVMSRRLGGVDYADSAGERLCLPENAGSYPGGCEMHLVSGSGQDASAAAARIRRLLEEGFPVREGEGTRPCRPEDFCILLRTRKSFGAYVQALEAQGLEVYADVSENLLEAPAVRPLVSLLRVLDNPAQDVPLASVLLSPLVGMSLGELTWLRAEHPGGSLYTALLPRHEAGQEEPAPARQKAEAFRARLEALRRLSRTLPVDRLLEEIYADTGYPALVGAMPGGAARRDELRRFTEFASAMGEGGLSSLIRALDAMEESGQVVSPGAGALARPGHVSVMTIHRSKGLEFPIVLLADTGRAFNLSDQRDPVLFHRQLGLGLKLRGESGLYPTLAQTAILRAKKAEALSEEMRVFYVALTRARDRLILFVPYKQKEGADALPRLLEKPARALQCAAGRESAAHAQNMGQWLLLGALQNTAGAFLWQKAGLEPPDKGESWPMELFMEDDQPPAARPAAPRHTARPDPELLEKLRQGMAWRYPHEARTRVAAKVSVTSVVHREEKEVLMERPAFMMKDGLTGAERGTALHAFMEHADFELAQKDLQAEARRQKENDLLEEGLFEKLDFAGLERFFASDLFGRIRKAKRLLREYDFISAIPARQLAALPEDQQILSREGEQVLLQGVADLILIFEDHAEIVDYKTDRGKTEEDFVRAYAPQLEYYARAISRRLAPLPITRCSLYSFALGREICLPVAENGQKEAEKTGNIP